MKNQEARTLSEKIERLLDGHSEEAIGDALVDVTAGHFAPKHRQQLTNELRHFCTDLSEAWYAEEAKSVA